MSFNFQLDVLIHFLMFTLMASIVAKLQRRRAFIPRQTTAVGASSNGTHNVVKKTSLLNVLLKGPVNLEERFVLQDPNINVCHL